MVKLLTSIDVSQRMHKLIYLGLDTMSVVRQKCFPNDRLIQASRRFDKSLEFFNSQREAGILLVHRERLQELNVNLDSSVLEAVKIEKRAQLLQNPNE